MSYSFSSAGDSAGSGSGSGGPRPHLVFLFIFVVVVGAGAGEAGREGGGEVISLSIYTQTLAKRASKRYPELLLRQHTPPHHSNSSTDKASLLKRCLTAPATSH